MAKRLSASAKKARVEPSKVKSAEARREVVRNATSRVRARTTIDFPRSVRST